MFTKLKIYLGFICPIHHAPTWWDDSYGKSRCSVTGAPVRYEKVDL